MEILSFTDYRTALSELFAWQKKLWGQRWTLSGLADQAGLQASYLTNVIKGRAHFSADQLRAIADAMKLSQVESEYLLLLLEWERSSYPPRKKDLSKCIEEIRRKNLSSIRYVTTKESPLSEKQQETYYLDPNVELLHMYLGVPRLSQEIKEISKSLAVTEEFIRETLKFLESTGLVEVRKGRWVKNPVKQHLPEDSPICRPHQSLVRFKSLDHIQKIPKEKKYSFMATVTMDEEARLKIQAAYLSFLKEAQNIVEKSEPEGIYQIQFDMFPWLKSDE